MDQSNRYPDFPYAANELVKFIATAEVTSIMLKNGEIVHYSPQNTELFTGWLRGNKVIDLRAENAHNR